MALTPNLPASDQATAVTDRHFRTDNLLADLKGRSVRGGVITLTAQAVKFVMQLASTVVLARLLTPAEFGLVAMVTAITGFVAIFKDLGLSQATVQRAEITHGQVSMLFWINVAMSFALMLLIMALSPVVAWFYGEPRLVQITLVLSGTFLLTGASVQHQALLSRQMRFNALVVIELVSMASGIATGVVMAWRGFGYWALVGMPVGSAIGNAVTIWLASPWRPSLPSRGCGVRPLLRFGVHLSGFNFVNYFSRNADNILIGWWWGAGLLGIYSKAYQLLMLPLLQVNAPVAAVAVPLLSRLQYQPGQYRDAYCRLVRALSVVVMPWIAFAIVIADWLLGAILGSQWIPAAAPFRFLAIVAIVQPVSNTCGWLFLTQDRVDEQLKCGVVNSSICVASFFAGLPHGINGVAFAYALSGLAIRTPILFSWVGRSGPVSARNIYGSFLPPLAITVLLLAVLSLIRWTTSASGMGWTVVGGGAITIVVAVLMMFWALPPAQLYRFCKWQRPVEPKAFTD